MFRTFSLSCLALLGAQYVGGAALPADVGVVVSAHAADFTGRVKRIKIKKRRSGSSYKIVALTGGDSSDSVGSVSTEMKALDGGPTMAAVKMDAPRAVRARYEMVAKLSGDGPYTYTLKTEIGGVSEVFVLEGLTLDGPWVEDSSTGGGVSVRMRLADNGGGGATALAGALDRDHDGGILDNLGGFLSSGSITNGAGVAGGFGAATMTGVTERYVSQLKTSDGGDPTGYAYSMATTVRDASGVVVDSQTEQITIASAGEDDGVQTVKLRQNKKGLARAVTLTNSLNGDVAALEVQLVDNKTGAYVLDAYDTEPVSLERWFQVGGLEFDPGEEVDGYTYLMLADLIGSGGKPVGNQMEFEVSVASGKAYVAPNGDTLPDNTVATFSSELLYGTWEKEPDGTFTAFVAYAGADAALVDGINLIFEEPYEGPAPLETELNLELELEWKKWVQKSDTSLPDGTASLSVNVVSDEGVVLDSVTATTLGTGAAFVDDNADGVRKYGDILIDGVPLEFD